MYDIAIIGGGINGAGIARDAAGRGFSVFLAEKSDLASGTSSWSTKLIHGGLRYLEYYEFRLVREALKEREVLWSIAPHVIWPLRFVLPHNKDIRPAWLIRLGLFLYDHIGGRKLLPGTRVLNLSKDEAGQPLKPGFKKAFEYSDCWVDDARLVILNARDAADKGAIIKTRTEVIKAEREERHWHLSMRNNTTGETDGIKARFLINASGPWVDTVINNVLQSSNERNIRLVQGSHIVVPKLFDHDRCYFFQNPDGRIFFAIPYEQNFTLIGTTDRDYSDEPDNVKISDEEKVYLCKSASNYFNRTITHDQIIWAYSGVRPLYEDGASKAQETTRDYIIKFQKNEEVPFLNIFGGKLTTYRKLAEAVLENVEACFGTRGATWTHTLPLPGGDFDCDGYDKLLEALLKDFSFLPKVTAQRYIRCYGTKTWDILGKASSYDDLGISFGHGLTECEVNYLCSQEWAMTAEDILWRRTKLGLYFTHNEINCLNQWLSSNRG